MITVTLSTSEDFFRQYILTLKRGDVFKFSGMEFETLLSILQRYSPNFKIAYVNPGTALYTTYGHSTAVVL